MYRYINYPSGNLTRINQPQVSVLRPRKATVTSTVHESLASLGIALAGGNIPSVAEAIMNHSEIADVVFQLWGVLG